MANKPYHDESEFYKHYKGKRTKKKDILTLEEVRILEETVEPFKLSYDYDGEVFGTEHSYQMTAARAKQLRQERIEQEREARQLREEELCRQAESAQRHMPKAFAPMRDNTINPVYRRHELAKRVLRDSKIDHLDWHWTPWKEEPPPSCAGAGAWQMSRTYTNKPSD